MPPKVANALNQLMGVRQKPMFVPPAPVSAPVIPPGENRKGGTVGKDAIPGRPNRQISRAMGGR